MKPIASLLLLLSVCLLCALGAWLPAVAVMGIGSIALSAPSARACNTLTSPQEILMEVADAFLNLAPAVRTLGGQWVNTGVKKNKKYTGHIAGAVTARDITTTLFPSAADPGSLLTDLDITASYAKGAPLTMDAITMAARDKNSYEKLVKGAAHSLASAFFNAGVSYAASQYCSYSAVYAAVDADMDMLSGVQTTLNENGALPYGRTMIVNSSYAGNLCNVTGIASRDFFGQQNVSAIRAWRGIAGFDLVQEFPGLSNNNGSAITGIAAATSGNLYTKSAHGLVTGQRVQINSGWSASIGFSTNDYAYVIYASASTFQLATTLANALAGTAATVSNNATGGSLTVKENIAGFATDGRGIEFVAGPLDLSATDEMLELFGAQKVVSTTTVQHESGLVFGAVAAQDPSTGAVSWTPTLVFGFRAGRDSSTTIGDKTDKGIVLLRTE